MKRIIAISAVLILGTASLVMVGTSNQTSVSVPATAQAQDVDTLAAQEVAMTAVQPTSVVELFTSQGCSSCPPANDFAAKMAQDEAVSYTHLTLPTTPYV